MPVRYPAPTEGISFRHPCFSGIRIFLPAGQTYDRSEEQIFREVAWQEQGFPFADFPRLFPRWASNFFSPLLPSLFLRIEGSVEKGIRVHPGGQSLNLLRGQLHTSVSRKQQLH